MFAFRRRSGVVPPNYTERNVFLQILISRCSFFISTQKSLHFKLHLLYWLLGWKSQLSTNNKLLLYKTILKPIWTYGIQLWGTASTSNFEILERFQSKVLRMIVDAPWYVPNSSSEGTSTALQSKKKSAVTALTMVIDFALIPII
jgi:hypothetical protein